MADRLPAGSPLPDHCRVLEEMFPGWSAAQLFQPSTPELLYADRPPPGAGPGSPNTLGPPVFVAPSVGLRPFIEHAFTSEHVRIDFAGFSGETLHGVIQEPLDKIRIGRIKPESLTIRLLLPDTSKPIALPCRAEDLGDDVEFRARATRLTARHAHAILDTVHELTGLGLLAEATAEIRAHRCAPLFKLYILNGEEAFFGFYPIVQQTVPLADGPHEIYDLMGKDTVVFHHSMYSGQPTDAAYIEQAQSWFDSMWQTVSYEYPT